LFAHLNVAEHFFSNIVVEFVGVSLFFLFDCLLYASGFFLSGQRLSL
jgi:hypothetical protein